MTKLKNLNSEFPDEEPEIEDGKWVEPEEETTTEPFDPTLIRMDTRSMTIDLLLRRINERALDLAPDFQRRAGIWKDAAKSRLIESILIRIPLPAFYIDATNEDTWLVVDGLQRLTTLKEFVIDKKLKLSQLEYLSDIKGKTFDDLPRRYQRRIEEASVTVYLIEKGTPPEVKFNIFRRINTGGLPLSPQELRHALNPGEAPKFLARLADSEEFNQVTGLANSRKTLRMEDREFVLRFLAFFITSYENYKFKSLDAFLNEAMEAINDMAKEDINYLVYPEEEFKRIMRAAYSLFGEYAFRKQAKDNINKNPLNKALFEAWSVNLSKLKDEEIQILIARKQELIDGFINLMANNPEFMASISQSTDQVKKVRCRFSEIEKLITNVLS